MIYSRMFTKKIFVFLTLFALISPLVAAQPALAAGISRFDAVKDNPDSQRFVYTLNAGETKEDNARISNDSNNEEKVEIMSRDGEITSDGALAIISNSLQNTQAGKWIQLDQKNYTIPAKNNVKVPFKISVPAGTPSGEYYAGLSVMEVGSGGAAQGGGNVAVKTRVAVKVFILVKGSLEANTKVDSLNIIDPKDSDFNVERAKWGKLGKDNMYLSYKAENTGNIFLRLVSKYKITLPDGSVSEGETSQDLPPKTGARKFYIDTDKKPYKAGTTKVELKYEAKPVNKIEGDVKNGTLSGTLNDELNMSQDEVDKFAQSRVAVNQEAEDVQKNGPRSPIIVREKSHNTLAYILGGVVILLLLGIIAMQIMNSRKKNSDKK
jgi:hypothetical protein